MRATPLGSRLPTSGAGATWAVGGTQGRTRGECGLYVTDGTTQVTVTLDRDAGSGTLGWFSKLGNTHNEPFTVPAGPASELALVDDQGVIAVLLGGRRVATVVDPVLRPPTGSAWPPTATRPAATSTTSRSRPPAPLTDLLADAVALVALAALLVTAILHLPWRQEAAVAVVATVVVLATGLVGRDQLEDTVRGCCLSWSSWSRSSWSPTCVPGRVFAAAARLVGRASHGRPDRLLLGVFLLAALVTTVLSLDATVVLLTPIVVAAAAALGTSDRPGAFACLRMANSASLLLPVSNLTNLLALPYLDLDFLGFAARMAPVLLVVLVVEYVGLRLLFRRDLAAPQPEHGESRSAGARRTGRRGRADARRLRGAVALGRRAGVGVVGRGPGARGVGRRTPAGAAARRRPGRAPVVRPPRAGPRRGGRRGGDRVPR